MNILEKIQQNFEQFTPGERLVADYVIQYPIDAVRYSAEVLAERSHTSRSNVVRLCQKLGYSGFAEFKYEMNRHMNRAQTVSTSADSADGDTTSRHDTAFEKFLACFRLMEPLCGSPHLKECADMLCQAPKTIILGIYHSYFTAQQLAFRLNRCGMDAHAINDASIMESYIEILSPGEVAVIVSISGGKNYVDVLKSYKKKGIRTILITMTEHSPAARHAYVTILLPCITRQYSDAILDDAPVFYFFIELLIDEMNRQSHGSIRSAK